MRIGVVGINHKLAHVKLREQLATICQRRFGIEALHLGEPGFVLLSTCNRTEIYFSSGDLSSTHTYILAILQQEVGECDDFDQKLYSYFGVQCLAHLARVTAGLDSAIVAETEIQGQVKVAYEAIAQRKTLSCDLHYLFQKALHIARQARTRIPMSRGMPDLEHAIFNIGTHLFSKDYKNANVLFIGASNINCKILNFFKSKGIQKISLCNRSQKRGDTICQKYGASLHEWEQLSQWHQFDWIICGTKSPQYLLNKEDLLGSQQKPTLVIDLSVPRNADPLLAREGNITLLNIDQVNKTLKFRKQKMNNSLIQAETFVTESAQRSAEQFIKKNQLRLPALAAI